MQKIKNKKAVFGLNAIQSFFAVILGLGLLAYIIVVIMGVLSGTTILKQTTYTVTNETGGFVNVTGYTLSKATEAGFSSPSITQIVNATDGTILVAANYTLTGNIVYNASAIAWPTVKISYTYTANTIHQNNLNGVLANTSTGITGFFSAINPVYAILAVLVIILVLVVLVRVVQSPGQGSTPQL